MSFNSFLRLSCYENENDLIREYNNKGIDITKFIEQIKTKFTASKVKSKMHRNSKTISKITLHVSNSCNLKCKYCYANEGTYNLPSSKLTKETADNFIKFCIDNFDQVKDIHFFGGEPFLNLDIMVYICQAFHQAYKDKKVKLIPKFGVITNGTILNDNIVKFIDNYIHSITVSIDGLKQINNINRVYKNGRGTFDEIYKFIQIIKSKTKTNIFFESTFTKEHILNGYKHMDIYNPLTDLLKIDGAVINEKSVNYAYIDEFIRQPIDIKNLDFDNFPSEFWQVLNSIVNNQDNVICPVYEKLFAVSTQGEIYPCQLVLGKPKVYCGNIKDKNIYTHPQEFKSILSKELSKKNAVCKSCWAHRLCGGCAVDFFFNTDMDDFDSSPRIKSCRLTRDYITKLLSIILALKSDNKMWNSLMLYINANKSKINNVAI